MSHSPSKSTSGDRAKTTQPSEPSKRHSAISNMFSRAQSGHAEEVENHSSSSKRVRLPKIPPVDDQYQMKYAIQSMNCLELPTDGSIDQKMFWLQ